MSDDFSRVAKAAVDAAEVLVPEWLPDGKRSGREWKSRNPTRADRDGSSFSINLIKGIWSDFATGDEGDLIDLYAYLFGTSKLEAMRTIAQRLGVPISSKSQADPVARPPRPAQAESGVEKPEKLRKTEWIAQPYAPADPPPLPVAHYHYGRPEACWTYRDTAGRLVGVIHRYRRSGGGKEVMPITWAEHPEKGGDWRWLAFAEPRPLYGAELLSSAPDSPVLLVEGEKCADAARPIFPDHIVLTWPGGGKAVGKCDWAVLTGRQVVIWPDADSQREKVPKGDARSPEDMPLLPAGKQPGLAAARKIADTLLALGCRVDIVTLPEPGTLPAGWDVADAVAEGWSDDQIWEWVFSRLEDAAPVLPAPTPEPAGAGRDGLALRVVPESLPEGEGGEVEPDRDWQRRLLCTDAGLIPNLHNAHLILENDPNWRGVLGYDQFGLQIVKRRLPPYPRAQPGDWTDYDTSRTLIWLQSVYGLNLKSPEVVLQAVGVVAQDRGYHPVRDWLESLPAWDGVERLAFVFDDVLGATEPYAGFAAQALMVAAVRRIYEPGCKVDEMLVLEGPQGYGKSTFVHALFGSGWYLETAEDPAGKDFYVCLQGRWGVEIGELGSFRRSADWTKVKMAISRRNDHFRAPYGRTAQSHLRQCVFVGTTNESEWVPDATGGRRFIPLVVRQSIDLDLINANRDLWWAEAIARYRSGFEYWRYPPELLAVLQQEQADRQIQDGWLELVTRWLDGKAPHDHYPPTHSGRINETTTTQLLMQAIGMEAAKIQRDHQTRVGNIMTQLGWIKRRKRDSAEPGVRPYFYCRPDHSLAERKQGCAA